jgi:hypothetical protein
MPSFTNTSPFEVIAAPFRVYKAPVGTTHPLVSVAEDDISFALWTLIGKSGDLNYDRGAGVKVSHPQNMNFWRSVGDAGSRKAFRVDEDLKVMLRLVDFRLEGYSLAVNENEVDTATPGQKKIGLSRGFAVATHALLIRGISPYEDGANAQYEIPIAALSGSSEVELAKPGEPAAFDLEWTALVDPTATDPSEYFGRLIAEDSTIT